MNRKLLQKGKSISIDFIYNILASVVLLGTMQIIVYPLLARKMLTNDYGTALTVMGGINTIAGSLGGSLNNVRLILNTEYERKKEQGDFNFILLFSASIGAIILTLALRIYFAYSVVVAIIGGATVFLIIIRQYFVVEYRIVLNFKNNLMCSIAGAVGYLIGILLFWVGVSCWILPFTISEIISFGYIIKSTKVYKEPYRRTKLFGGTLKKYFTLIASTLSGNIITYFDRIFLYPILGGDAVSTYTVAAFFGKSFSLIMTPISGVILGYFSQKNFKMTRKLFVMFASLVTLLSFVFIFFSGVVSPFFTNLLYPTIYTLAKPYIFIANTAAIISVSCGLIQPALLEFAPTHWQLIKELVFAICYFSLSWFLMNRYGMYGFCYAVLIANIIKYIVSIIMVFIALGKEKIQCE